MGFFDNFTNIILGVVALVVLAAAFETTWVLWRAKRKRERQNRSHDSGDV